MRLSRILFTLGLVLSGTGFWGCSGMVRRAEPEDRAQAQSPTTPEQREIDEQDYIEHEMGED